MPRGVAIAVWVGLLGAVGSLARLGVGVAVARLAGPGSIWPTAAVNLLGSFAMGAAIGLLAPESGAPKQPFGIGVTAGLLGGFTTYSAFAYQTWDLIERQRPAWAALNVALTLVGCLAACAVGVTVGRGLRG